MMTLLAQAAVEYIGVTLQSAMRSVGPGLRAAGQYMEDNPLVVAAAAAGLLLLVRRRCSPILPPSLLLYGPPVLSVPDVEVEGNPVARGPAHDVHDRSCVAVRFGHAVLLDEVVKVANADRLRRVERGLFGNVHGHATYFRPWCGFRQALPRGGVRGQSVLAPRDDKLLPKLLLQPVRVR